MKKSTGNSADAQLYAIWKAMRQRCNNTKNKNFASYGGRGIKVCARWALFENFLQDMGPRPTGATLERIDNDGNYSPENCRWAAWDEQANNRRNAVRIKYSGAEFTRKQIAALAGVSEVAVWKRQKLGWSVEKIIKTPNSQPWKRKSEEAS